MKKLREKVFNKQNIKEYIKGTAEANLPAAMGCNSFLNEDVRIPSN